MPNTSLIADIRRFPTGKRPSSSASSAAGWAMSGLQSVRSRLNTKRRFCAIVPRIIKQADPMALSGISGWLRDQGVIESPAGGTEEVSGIEVILEEYAGWMREERALTPSTIDNHLGYVRRFLTSIFGAEDPQLAGILSRQITDYIRRSAPHDWTFSQAKNIVTSLRSFFRFARFRDYTQADLAAVVPSVAGWG